MSMTVQKMCKAARDEGEVREAQSRIWEKPSKAMDVITSLEGKNRDTYELGENMETKNDEKRILIRH